MVINKRNTVAWRAGYRAFDEGLNSDDNPYNKASVEVDYQLWHDGWFDAREDLNGA